MTERQINFLKRAGGVFGDYKLVRHTQMSSVTFAVLEPYDIKPPLQPNDYQAFYDVCDASIAHAVELESSASNWELDNPHVYTVGEMRFVSTNQRVIFFELKADIKDVDRGRRDGKIEDTFAVVYGSESDDRDIPQFGGTVFELFSDYAELLRENIHYHDSQGVIDSRDDFDILDI